MIITPKQKKEKICDICYNKYHLYTHTWSNDYDYRIYWFKNGVNTLGEVVKYDEYLDKITIATMVVVNYNGKLLFCMYKHIEFEDFEQELDNVMLEYKKALVNQKVQEIEKDFKV